MIGFAYIQRVIKSPTFASFGAFAGSGVIVTVISGLGGLLQARWVAPEVFGEFQQYAILTGYLGILSQVVNDGLIRQYPYYIGKGDKEKALEVAGIAKWWFLLATSIGIAIFASLTIKAAIRGDLHAVLGWGAQIVAIVVAFYGAFLGIMYRTANDFKRLSLNNLIHASAGFSLLVLVRYFGYCGVATRNMLQNAVQVFVNHKYLPVKVKAHFEWAKFKDLSSISLKFSIPAYMHASGLSSTRGALLLYFCSKSGLGIYSMAVAFKLMVMGLSNSLNQIFNVKVITRYGQTENIWACLKYSARPAFLAALLSLCVVVGGWLGLPPFIKTFVPKYTAAIPVINVLLVSVLIAPLSLPLLSLKAALMWKSAAAQAFSNFIVTVSMILLLPKEPIMFAVATVCGEFSESLVGYGILFNIYRNRRNAR